MINWFDFPKLSNNPEWEHEFLKGNTNLHEYKKHEFSRTYYPICLIFSKTQFVLIRLISENSWTN